MREEDAGASGPGAETFSAGIETLLALYAPDLICYPAPGWVEGDAVCYGHDGFRKLSAVWLEMVDDVSFAIDDVRDLHERVLVLATFSGRSRDTGAPVSQRFGVINSDIRADGKVGEARFFLTWQEAVDAAGLAE
jgi:hypothetical protein